MNDKINGDSFLQRVISSDPAKKGVVALATGVLFAVISEAIWPSR